MVHLRVTVSKDLLEAESSVEVTFPQQTLSTQPNNLETILFPIGRNVSVLPVVENANIPYRLEAPLQLFNHLYDIAYVSLHRCLYRFIAIFKVSANGLVSFDRPFSEIVPQPRELRSVVIFPFHVQNNLGTGGNVSVRQVTG